MKILFVFYLPSGGMETLNRIRASALIAHGVDCQLLYLLNAGGRQNIRNIPTNITNEDDEIKAILDREQFDAIIICTDFLFLKRIRALGYKGKVIYEVQGLGSYDEALSIIQRATPNIQAYSDALLYPKTPHLIKLLQKSFPSKAQFCFDNPIETETFGYRSTIVPTDPIIGWVGRIEPNKNWTLFLEICYWMLQYNPALHIWMFEDPNLSEESERKKFDAMVDYIHARTRLIQFVNIPHADMADYYSKIGDSGGFICSTSMLEGFGYSVAEALLCRCPVVTSDSDGIRNFITHNVTGKIFPQQDLIQAVKESKEIMENIELRESIRNKGEEYIKQRFSPDKYVKEFIAMMGTMGIE